MTTLKISDIRPPKAGQALPASILSAEATSAHRKGNLIISLILIAVGILLILIIKSKSTEQLIDDPLIVIYTLFVTTFQLSRVAGAAMYNRSKRLLKANAIPETVPYEPMVTYVVPCKNEEGAIGKTVEMCFASDYPKDKLEVIIINDGSTDGTAQILGAKQFATLSNHFEILRSGLSAHMPILKMQIRIFLQKCRPHTTSCHSVSSRRQNQPSLLYFAAAVVLLHTVNQLWIQLWMNGLKKNFSGFRSRGEMTERLRIVCLSAAHTLFIRMTYRHSLSALLPLALSLNNRYGGKKDGS